MSDHLLIYIIVLLNALSQAMLIWRLKLAKVTKWKYCLAAVAVPLVLAVSVRMLIAQRIIHGRVTEQSSIEHLLTTGLSVLLVAGPWFVTAAAVIMSRRVKMNTA